MTENEARKDDQVKLIVGTITSEKKKKKKKKKKGSYSYGSTYG